MKIEYLKDYDDSHSEEMLQMIADKTRDWSAKKMDDADYHSQLSLLYSIIYMPEECKKHASLVPGWASAHIKSEALTSVARMLIYEKKIAEALEHYQQAYALDPENDTAIEEAGWCCLEMTQYASAEDWFTKANALDDDFVTYLEGLGRSLALQHKYAAAIPFFEKAVAYELRSKGENYAEIYYNLMGQCYAALDDFYRALACYTKSLEADPTYPSSLNDIATLYFNQEGDVSTAIDFLKKAEVAAEESKNAHILQTVYMNLAQLYNKIKEFDLHEFYQQKFLGTIFGFSVGFEDEDEAEGDREIDYDEIERQEAERERKEQEENEHDASAGTVRFILTTTNNGTYQFSLLDGKEKTIMTSAAYTSKAECEAAIAFARKQSGIHGYNQNCNKKGLHYFELIDYNATVIAKSRFYKKWQQRSAAVKFVKKYIMDAGLEDRTV